MQDWPRSTLTLSPDRSRCALSGAQALSQTEREEATLANLTLNLVAYERMGLCNPVSVDAVENMLWQAELYPDQRGAELGCGNAALAILLSNHGLIVSAFDRSEAMAALARERIYWEGTPDRVTVVAGEADVLAETGAPWRLLAVVGTTALSDFARLRDWLEPGGYLLWGDLFWKAEPPEPLRAAMGNPDYDTDAGWRERGARAGLQLIEARISSDADWIDYVAAIQSAVEEWSARNPDHPDRAAIRKRAEGLSLLYGETGRQFIGFGLYLFRKPA